MTGVKRGTIVAMTISTTKNPVRERVRAAPLYPFTPIDASVKLDQNESGFDVPPELKRDIFRRLEHSAWNRYPDMHAEGLRAKIAALEGWDPSGVVVTPGSNVLIYALTQIAGIGQRLLGVAPGFALYALSGTLLESKVTELPLEPDFSLPVQALCRELQSGGPGLLFLAEPHAPTGALHSPTDIAKILEAATDDWLVVLDEAYVQFCETDLKHWALERDNVVILRTFSKAWGLAGVRLGYMLSNPGLAANIQKILLPFNISVLNTVAAEVILEHPELMQARVESVKLERERMFAALSTHPSWLAYPSSANYILVRTSDAARVHRQLLERGVLVRRQDSYLGLEGCIRVSVGAPAENDAFLSAAKEIS
jgi:histidinol-phosphate aminotransferase